MTEGIYYKYASTRKGKEKWNTDTKWRIMSKGGVSMDKEMAYIPYETSEKINHISYIHFTRGLNPNQLLNVLTSFIIFINYSMKLCLL